MDFQEASSNTDLASVIHLNDTTYGMSFGTICSGENGDFIRFHTGSIGTERFRITASGTCVFKKNATQISTAVSALDIDCSTGNYFTKAISADSIFTFSNVPSSGEVYGFVLELDISGDRTLTWPVHATDNNNQTVTWAGGSAPTLTADKTHLFSFVTVDNGTTWRGSAAVDFTT